MVPGLAWEQGTKEEALWTYPHRPSGDYLREVGCRGWPLSTEAPQHRIPAQGPKSRQAQKVGGHSETYIHCNGQPPPKVGFSSILQKIREQAAKLPKLESSGDIVKGPLSWEGLALSHNQCWGLVVQVSAPTWPWHPPTHTFTDTTHTCRTSCSSLSSL
jgi:hypothetical protein